MAGVGCSIPTVPFIYVLQTSLGLELYSLYNYERTVSFQLIQHEPKQLTVGTGGVVEGKPKIILLVCFGDECC